MPAAKGLSVNFLDDELLSRIHERAAQVDADNAFPEEDFADLKAAGYYKAFVPTEFGGAGLTLQEIAREQTRLAQSDRKRTRLNSSHVASSYAAFCLKRNK